MTPDETLAAGQLMIDFADASNWPTLLENRVAGTGEWQLYDASFPLWDWFRYEYRRKPTPTLRPYTRAELIELVGKSLINKGNGSKWYVVYLHVGTGHSYCRLQCADDASQVCVSSEDLLAGCTHLDGSPCGVEVE